MSSNQNMKDLHKKRAHGRKTELDYKIAKRRSFMLWLEDPSRRITDIYDIIKSEGHQVHYVTLSKWVNDDEWNSWFTKSINESSKELAISLVKLQKKAINFLNNSLDGNLSDEEIKLAGVNKDIVKMVLQHAGLIDQKPFQVVNNTMINQIGSADITLEDLKNKSAEEVTAFLTGVENLEIDRKPQNEDDDVVLIPEEDFIKINKS